MLNVADVVLIAVVAVVVIVAARRFVGTAKGERDCCSGEATGTGAAPKGRDFAEVTITDTDPAHYPYEASLEIGGMSCERCVDAVTRALDSVEGTWAEVELAGGHALVRSKAPIDADAYRDVVSAAGYRLISVTEL